MGKFLGSRPEMYQKIGPTTTRAENRQSPVRPVTRDMVAEVVPTISSGVVETGLCDRGGRRGESFNPFNGLPHTAPVKTPLLSQLWKQVVARQTPEEEQAEGKGTVVPLREVAELLREERYAPPHPPSTLESEGEILYFSEDERESGKVSPCSETSPVIRMIAAGEGEENPRASLTEAERRFVLNSPPGSPPTTLVPLPTMEVDFSEQDALRPNQPPQLDAKILWDEFADIRQKLGRFGRGYMHGYAALGSWQTKLNNMAYMVVDMHGKLSELIDRSLAFEGQDPIAYLSGLYSKVQELEREMQQWQGLIRELQSSVSQLQQWQASASTLTVLPAQVAQVQAAWQGTAAQVAELQQKYTSIRTEEKQGKKGPKIARRDSTVAT